MTTNRLKHTEPSSTVPTGSDNIKARALESLSADQSALEDKTPETYSPFPFPVQYDKNYSMVLTNQAPLGVKPYCRDSSLALMARSEISAFRRWLHTAPLPI